MFLFDISLHDAVLTGVLQIWHVSAESLGLSVILYLVFFFLDMVLISDFYFKKTSH